MSSTPWLMPDPESKNATTIGKAVKVVGQIVTKEDLEIHGDVEGRIESPDHKISVGPSGRVQGSISGCNVFILGQVQGNVDARDKVEIRKGAKLVGDITTSRISIEDGAVFKGSIDIREPEPRPLSVVVPS